MLMNKYIYKVNLIVDGNVDDCELQADIDTAIENVLKGFKGVTVVSQQIADLTENTNCGICLNCGDYVSDKNSIDFINEFSNGTEIDGQWYCDICLPDDHKNFF